MLNSLGIAQDAATPANFGDPRAALLHMWCLQVADPTFFVRMIPMLDGGDDIGMVLSPQCFWNLNQGGDIFNHTNIHFW